MKKLRYLGFLTLLLAILMPLVPVAAATKPDADFIAKAMEQQELNCGASLEVWYTITRPAHGPLVKTIEDVHYIRTRNVLFMTIDRSGECACCVKERYDRVSQEVRRLTDPRAGGKTTARVFSGGLGGIMMCVKQDPILHSLDSGPLYRVIGQGVVADERDEIDGHLCWRVDIPERFTGYKTRHSWSIWVDPDIGLCPRRVKSTFTNEMNPSMSSVTVNDFLGYKSLGGGIFFPMAQRLWHDGEARKDESEPQICVKEVTYGREIPDEELTLKFPSGTEVEITSLNARYEEP